MPRGDSGLTHTTPGEGSRRLYREGSTFAHRATPSPHPRTRPPAHPRVVVDQIADSIAAQAAVEQLLREERTALEPEDEGSDTPIGGVAAASS